MRKDIEVELIGLIYDTATDPEFWPWVLSGLASELEELQHITTEQLAIESGKKLPEGDESSLGTLVTQELNLELLKGHRDMDEIHILQNCLPHFQRAFTFNKHFIKFQREKELTSALLDQLSLGIVIVDESLQVRFCNGKAKTFAQSDSRVYFHQDKFCLTEFEQFARLKDRVRMVIQGNHTDLYAQTIKFEEKESAPAWSLFIVPYDIQHLDIRDEKRYAAIFFSAPGIDVVVSEDMLTLQYGLSKAEAKLAAALVQGESVDFYAEKNGLSINTVKTQIKSILKKSDAHRQTEFIRMVLTGPATMVLSPEYRKPKENTQLPVVSLKRKPVNENCITLKDGRQLGYAEFGDPQGKPVLLFHSKYGCRLMRNPDDELTADLGVRLIVADRPGFGFSSVKANRGFLDWTDDVRELCQHLGVKRFSLVGHDIGGCYALACAYRIPYMIDNIVISNSYAPFLNLSEFNSCIPNEKLFMGLARYLPSLFLQFADHKLSQLSGDMQWYYERVKFYLPQCDIDFLFEENAYQLFNEMNLEAFKNIYGMAWDILLLARQWGFDPARIRKKIILWHGEQNAYVPFVMGKRLSAMLPKAEVQFFPNDGQFVTFTRWQELLGILSKTDTTLTISN